MFVKFCCAALLSIAIFAFAQSELESNFLVKRTDSEAYAQPLPALTYKQQPIFMQGRGHFNRRWVIFGVAAGDWGLGPTFIADRCGVCHVGGGRGAPPSQSNEQLTSMLVRISLPGADEHGAPKPVPNYGDQLQNRALQGQSFELSYSEKPVPEEAHIYLDWIESKVELADGTIVDLRKPKIRIEKLNFGPLPDNVQTSLRNAQPVFGMGLLEAVPEQTLRDIAARQQAQGFNGRVNMVWDDVAKRPALGRFGWKANQPNVRQQIAVAALGDMGVTSSLYFDQNCPAPQDICANEVPGNRPELIDPDWKDLEFWTLGLAVPAPRDQASEEVLRGAKLFREAQCDVCHVPTLTTADKFERLPSLAQQSFSAYTDLLLHDMGEDLADGRPDFAAGLRDWRTQPLWGLGLSQVVSGSSTLLHDGRARNVTEAILWHGGEAKVSRDAFARMSKDDRAMLVAFLMAI
jgi:CxxC motif-containing protein (DUF1111 family)